MSRPLYRGVSGVGRLWVTVMIHLGDFQGVILKQRGMISSIITHMVIRLIISIESPLNIFSRLFSRQP